LKVDKVKLYPATAGSHLCIGIAEVLDADQRIWNRTTGFDVPTPALPVGSSLLFCA